MTAGSYTVVECWQPNWRLHSTFTVAMFHRLNSPIPKCIRQLSLIRNTSIACERNAETCSWVVVAVACTLIPTEVCSRMRLTAWVIDKSCAEASTFHAAYRILGYLAYTVDVGLLMCCIMVNSVTRLIFSAKFLSDSLVSSQQRSFVGSCDFK